MTFRPTPGTAIGHYEVVTELARGGMAQVLLARDKQVGRDVALKLLSPELSEDPGFRTRFLREATATASLEHPHVIPVYDTGEFEGLLYIAMRYVAGPDLRAVLAKGRLKPLRALNILEQIASALDAAHSAGLVHRDVKPGNILLVEPTTQDEREHAYLTDFGLVWRPIADRERTQPGALLGTPNYAAPEQLQGRPLDGRADVYALGAVLFACLAGEPPMQRDSTIATMAAHLNDPPPRLTERCPDLPPALDAVVAQALAKSREDRPRTCVALIKSAKEALAGAQAANVVVPRSRGGVPVPLTSFVGRDGALESLSSTLERARLVTLLAVGGSGKSRLAIEAAHRRIGAPGEVAYLDLAATPVGGVGGELEHLLSELSSDANALLVLDECERHLAELGRVLPAALSERQGLRVLATSREPLRIPGESVFPVGPLPFPALGSEAEVLDTAAGRLFWDRAMAASPDLEPDPETLRSVSQICRALDGIPLALELAASRARSLPLERVAAQATRAPTELSATDSESRHHSLASVIDGSYRLLTPQAQQLFQQISVFAAAFTLEDVEEVCADHPADVADLLGDLVDRSLVVVQRDGRRTRYRLLTPLARFAALRLEESPGAALVHERHARRYLTPFAGRGGGQVDWAYPEALRALEWVSDHGDERDLRALAGRAAVTLGDWPTAIALLEPPPASGPEVKEALGVALCKVTVPGAPDYRRGQELLEQCLQSEPSAEVMAALAGTWRGRDDFKALTLYRDALALDATDTYALGNVLEYEVAETRSLEPVSARVDQIWGALVRCREQASRGENLPWARYDEGKLLALRGEEMAAAEALLDAARASSGTHPLDTTRRSLDRLAEAVPTAHPLQMAAELLHLLTRARDRKRTPPPLADSVPGDLRPPILVLAGDSASGRHSATIHRGAVMTAALQGFPGTIVSGGTTSGVSALAGDLATALPGADAVGYAPGVLPTDVTVDEDPARYRHVHRTESAHFGVAEPMHFWSQAMSASISPSQVSLLGIGGGPIAAFEYRLALLLGGWVGVLRESGRESSELLADPLWSGHDRLYEVPDDVDGIRRFIRRSQKS